MKDRRGVEIKVGDIAVHATNGRYGDYDVVRVIGFTDKRVRVNARDFFSSSIFTLSQYDRGLFDPHTLIVATLPTVEGRLNNE